MFDIWLFDFGVKLLGLIDNWFGFFGVLEITRVSMEDREIGF